MSKTLGLIKDNEARWVDMRFTDTRGKEQHVSIPASSVDESFFEDGRMFDGSSILGWKGINESDMILMPDDDTAVMRSEEHTSELQSRGHLVCRLRLEKANITYILQ